jgi:arylformamidase
VNLPSAEIIDISPLIHPGIAVFPGDTPFSERWLLDHEKGDHLTLSTIQSTVHLGAHTDAPSHYAPGGNTIDRRDLGLYIGPAQVIQVGCAKGSRISPKDMKDKKIQAERVLFKTRSYPDPDTWNSDFVSLSAALVDHLSRVGVRLVGIDTPSIDPAEDKLLESHQAVFKHDMAILEGIVLDHVAEGLYQLVALPLRIRGADATPVRAVLLR